jgi:hypothetical protein
MEEAVLKDWDHMVRISIPRALAPLNLSISLQLLLTLHLNFNFSQVNVKKILESPAYLHEDGRPIIGIWGKPSFSSCFPHAFSAPLPLLQTVLTPLFTLLFILYTNFSPHTSLPLTFRHGSQRQRP